ncbi:tripartite tricarboxylate transporter substrate binding protein [Bacillus sp. IB182487]|uniref:Tripartite tricarboxylate transporter substrate binding protein n=2 Tax=Metabacillus arenae TaxID=2771434 RepID=A0A926RYP9_9BACI|nr:tripartite tricarboxylate transporter substrate binding protein [Metabacillus arenae]
MSSNNQNGKNSSKDYSLPNGDITDIVPVAAGGGTDLTHRAIAEAAQEYLDKNINVVNVTGAGGSVGFSQTATKKANGLTIHSYTSEIFTLPIFQKASFSPDDFKPFILMNEDPAAIVVPANSEFETIEDFIKAAKDKPGKISIGNSGFGNIWHLSAAAFANKAEVELKHVPFDGAAPTLQAALGGHIDAFVASPPEVSSQVETGTLRILAVMAEERSEKFSDVPTLKEKGIDLSIGTWRGLGVPADTPDEAVQILHDAFAKAVKEEDFQSFMKERGLTIRYMNTEEFTQFVEGQRPFFEELAKEVSKTKE